MNRTFTFAIAAIVAALSPMGTRVSLAQTTSSNVQSASLTRDPMEGVAGPKDPAFEPVRYCEALDAHREWEEQNTRTAAANSRTKTEGGQDAKRGIVTGAAGGAAAVLGGGLKRPGWWGDHGAGQASAGTANATGHSTTDKTSTAEKVADTSDAAQTNMKTSLQRCLDVYAPAASAAAGPKVATPVSQISVGGKTFYSLAVPGVDRKVPVTPTDNPAVFLSQDCKTMFAVNADQTVSSQDNPGIECKPSGSQR